jgi:hypothetical protein
MARTNYLGIKYLGMIYKNIIFCTCILVISNGSVGGNNKAKQTKMAGPACCSNPPILNSFAGAGHVDKIGGLNAYLTGSPHSTRAILFVSDIYGTLVFSTLFHY